MSQNTVKLFKTLISESSKIPDFNFRNYFIRRITDTFYSGQELRPEEEILGSLARSKISARPEPRRRRLATCRAAVPRTCFCKSRNTTRSMVTFGPSTRSRS